MRLNISIISTALGKFKPWTLFEEKKITNVHNDMYIWDSFYLRGKQKCNETKTAEKKFIFK